MALLFGRFMDLFNYAKDAPKSIQGAVRKKKKKGQMSLHVKV